jgi:hypothetical protein
MDVRIERSVRVMFGRYHIGGPEMNRRAESTPIDTQSQN